MSPSSGCGYTVIDDDNIQFAIKEDEDVGVNPVSDDDFENIMNEFEQLASVLQSKEIKEGVQLQKTDQNENSDMKQLADFESITISCCYIWLLYLLAQNRPFEFESNIDRSAVFISISILEASSKFDGLTLNPFDLQSFTVLL